LKPLVLTIGYNTLNQKQKHKNTKMGDLSSLSLTNSLQQETANIALAKALYMFHFQHMLSGPCANNIEVLKKKILQDGGSWSLDPLLRTQTLFSKYDIKGLLPLSPFSFNGSENHGPPLEVTEVAQHVYSTPQSQSCSIVRRRRSEPRSQQLRQVCQELHDTKMKLAVLREQLVSVIEDSEVQEQLLADVSQKVVSTCNQIVLSSCDAMKKCRDRKRRRLVLD
tara:strand:+ start:179 stop:847 length:669 start_codon:yes stop_codon:yes gene_type:complete